jgi:protocatechuate 3,4-dioxygenase beta subunit
VSTVTSGRWRRLFAGLFAVILIFGAVAPVVLTSGIGSASSGEVSGATSGSDAVPFAATTPTDNESTQHEDPDEAGEDGDLGSVKGWLLGRMSGRLEGSLINLSQGQYDAAEGLLGEETEDFLGQYVDVAGETESEEDDETAETVNETIEEQRNFTQSRRNFSELYQEYLGAIENGNLERARRLARQLADLERQLTRTGRNITRNYQEVENSTGVDAGEQRRIINRTAQNVSEIQQEIDEDLFTETRVEITSYTPNASLLDPLVIRGRVVTENGTPVSEGIVRIQSALDATATLNATGDFTLRHRPILLPVGEMNRTLAYQPTASSPYLGSTSNVTVTISGDEPSLEITETPEIIGFGNNISVLTSLSVENRSINGVPIVTTLGGVPLSTTVTTNGTANLSGTVPAAIDDGPQELRVSLPVSGRAITTTNATQTVVVSETDTRLTTNVTVLSSTRVLVRGRLETFDGTPLPGRMVRVTIDDMSAGNTTTNVARANTTGANATGAFVLNVTIPEGLNVSAFEDRRVPVSVTFSQPGTNLGDASTEQLITVPSESTAGDGGLFGLGIPALAWATFAVLVLWVAGAYVVLRRWEDRALTDTGRDGVDTPPTGPAGSESATEVDEEEPDAPTSLLAIATERLEAGASDTATEAGYEAVRQRLEERLGVVSGTHWELYRASQNAGWPEDRVTAIRRLTEAYEQAAFAPGSLSGDTAWEAVATAQDLLEEGTTASGGD